MSAGNDRYLRIAVELGAFSENAWQFPAREGRTSDSDFRQNTTDEDTIGGLTKSRSASKIDRSRRVQPRAARVWESWRSWRTTCSRVSSQAACSVLSPERQCSCLLAAPLPPSRSHRLRSSGPTRPPASKRSTIIIGATTAALTTTITTSRIIIIITIVRIIILTTTVTTIGRIIIITTIITTIGRIITITTIGPIFTNQQPSLIRWRLSESLSSRRAMELIRGRERDCGQEYLVRPGGEERERLESLVRASKSSCATADEGGQLIPSARPRPRCLFSSSRIALIFAPAKRTPLPARR